MHGSYWGLTNLTNITNTMAGRLQGKTAVITGGAQNIGLAIARLFAAQGARVVVADKQLPPPSARVDELTYIACDVANESEVQAMLQQAAGQAGIDVLVNNAGIALESKLEETALADWERVMSVNVSGVFLCSKHVAAAMRQASGGSIINIGSIEGLGANPLHAAYAAAKGAVHALTRNIALEYGAFNIRCNAIAPGWIDTPFNEQLLQKFSDVAATRRAIENLHPIRRLGGVEDIANWACFLASDESAFATGQVYVLDGGRTACLPLPPLADNRA